MYDRESHMTMQSELYRSVAPHLTQGIHLKFPDLVCARFDVSHGLTHLSIVQSTCDEGDFDVWSYRIMKPT